MSESESSLPGPNDAVGYQANIKPLFRERDQESMSFAFDLWSYEDVRAHAAEILSRLESGTMPCDAPWPDARTAVFKRWVDTGTRP